MLEERGVVVAMAENGQVFVATQRQSACGNCQSEKSCGTNLLANSSAQRQTMTVNANGYSLAIDDVVLLAIDESVVWLGMLQLYVWPLTALILGAILGQSLAGEIGAMIGAFGCLILSLWSVRWRTQRENDNYLPIVIKKLT
jgi:sigma-E factor negative regulatory protein RseC